MKNSLFRAKRIDNNQWVYGDVIHDIAEHSAPRICIDREYSTGTTFVANAPRVDYKTLSQYTGLKDKNENEIFEGDILKCYSPDGKNYIFCSISFGECEDDEGDTLYALYLELNSEKKILYPRYNQYEVVGNIWDNSELLKEAE